MDEARWTETLQEASGSVSKEAPKLGRRKPSEQETSDYAAPEATSRPAADTTEAVMERVAREIALGRKIGDEGECGCWPGAEISKSTRKPEAWPSEPTRTKLALGRIRLGGEGPYRCLLPDNPRWS